MRRLKAKHLVLLVVSLLAATLLAAYLLMGSAPHTLVRGGIPYHMPETPPITVSFVSLDKQADGTRVACFSMSNHTARPVDYMTEASSQPRSSVLQSTGIFTNASTVNGRTIYRVYQGITNHNSSPPLGPVRSLRPGASVTCSVRIPQGVTNEMVLLHYIPRQTLGDILRWAGRAARLSVPVRQYEESYPLWEPFESVAKK